MLVLSHTWNCYNSHYQHFINNSLARGLADSFWRTITSKQKWKSAASVTLSSEFTQWTWSVNFIKPVMSVITFQVNVGKCKQTNLCFGILFFSHWRSDIPVKSVACGVMDTFLTRLTSLTRKFMLVDQQWVLTRSGWPIISKPEIRQFLNTDIAEKFFLISVGSGTFNFYSVVTLILTALRFYAAFMPYRNYL